MLTAGTAPLARAPPLLRNETARSGHRPVTREGPAAEIAARPDVAARRWQEAPTPPAAARFPYPPPRSAPPQPHTAPPPPPRSYLRCAVRCGLLPGTCCWAPAPAPAPPNKRGSGRRTARPLAAAVRDRRRLGRARRGRARGADASAGPVGRRGRAPRRLCARRQPRQRRRLPPPPSAPRGCGRLRSAPHRTSPHLSAPLRAMCAGAAVPSRGRFPPGGALPAPL